MKDRKRRKEKDGDEERVRSRSRREEKEEKKGKEKDRKKSILLSEVDGDSDDFSTVSILSKIQGLFKGLRLYLHYPPPLSLTFLEKLENQKNYSTYQPTYFLISTITSLGSRPIFYFTELPFDLPTIFLNTSVYNIPIFQPFYTTGLPIMNETLRDD